MADKTAAGLVEYAKAQVGSPYWFGTYGQTATQSLLDNMKAQYPSYYTASDFKLQIGQRVHDCSGLIKGYLWSDSATSTPVYKASQDRTAASMYSDATEKGKISTFPKENGVLVFKGTYASSISHVGIYCTDGYVYEAKGHAYGVKKTKFSSSDWNFWAKHKDITYGSETVTETTTSEETTKTASNVTATKSAQYKDVDLYWGSWVVTASTLNMRNDAGKKSGNKIIATFAKGTVVNCYGYYSTYNEEVWLYVTLTYQGVQYTGFMSLEYLAKG